MVSGNVLRITAPEQLKADDFPQIAPQVDSIISRYGKIRLLIDATAFEGWENMAAFETHAGFVKDHQEKVDRIAIIIAHDWQRWLVGARQGIKLDLERRKTLNESAVVAYLRTVFATCARMVPVCQAK